MLAHTSAWLLEQVHAHLAYLCHANSEIFLPNQFAAPAATIQAHVNSTIGIRLPLTDHWMKAFSDNTEMSTIHDLVVNPSKIYSSTLNTVNYNYRAPLCQSQIVFKDVQGESSYTCLQLVPSKFYNTIFIVFHSNEIGRHLYPYCTLHCI